MPVAPLTLVTGFLQLRETGASLGRISSAIQQIAALKSSKMSLMFIHSLCKKGFWKQTADTGAFGWSCRSATNPERTNMALVEYTEITGHLVYKDIKYSNRALLHVTLGLRCLLQ